MSVIHICVGFCVILAILIVSILIGLFLAWISDDYDGLSLFIAWFICAIGFGMCLTTLLFQNGVI